MRKALLPVAAILGWSVALAAVSSLEAMDAEQDPPVIAVPTERQEPGGEQADRDAEHAALKQ